MPPWVIWHTLLHCRPAAAYYRYYITLTLPGFRAWREFSHMHLTFITKLVSLGSYTAFWPVFYSMELCFLNDDSWVSQSMTLRVADVGQITDIVQLSVFLTSKNRPKFVYYFTIDYYTKEQHNSSVLKFCNRFISDELLCIQRFIDQRPNSSEVCPNSRTRGLILIDDLQRFQQR